MSGKDRAPIPHPLPIVSGPRRVRFEIDGGDVYDNVAGKKILGGGALCDLLNAMQVEIAELREHDAEWWTLASGEGVGTPTKKDVDRVQAKIALMRGRFYDRGMRAGIESASVLIADWLRSNDCDNLFGTASRTTRAMIADALTRGAWRKR